jgi:hypothetical protein
MQVRLLSDGWSVLPGLRKQPLPRELDGLIFLGNPQVSTDSDGETVRFSSGLRARVAGNLIIGLGSIGPFTATGISRTEGQ